jgi:hypothetical protein
VPLYQGGGLKAQVEIRTLEQKEAITHHANLALRALEMWRIRSQPPSRSRNATRSAANARVQPARPDAGANELSHRHD